MDNKLPLFHVRTWHWIGDSPLAGLMMNQFTDEYMRHQISICPLVNKRCSHTQRASLFHDSTLVGGQFVRFDHVNSLWPGDAYMRQSSISSLIQIMACRLAGHYLNQCWSIIKWTLRNKFQWHFIRNSNIFIQGNVVENVVCEMASILSRPQWVNKMK